MLTLYHNDMSACSAKVRMALAEKGLEFESRHLNLRAGESRTPEYLKINPKGVVPALIHDGRIVTESVVIAEYLDEAFPEPPLRPADLVLRARMRALVKEIEGGVLSSIGTVSMSLVFHYQFEPDRIEYYSARVPGWRENFERARRGVENPAFPAAIARIDRMLSDLEGALAADGPWLVGEQFTLADIDYAPYVARVEHLQLGEMIARRPRLAAWYERIQQRPGYRKGVAAWFNRAYLSLMEEKGREAWPKVDAVLAAAA